MAAAAAAAAVQSPATHLPKPRTACAGRGRGGARCVVSSHVQSTRHRRPWRLDRAADAVLPWPDSPADPAIITLPSASLAAPKRSKQVHLFHAAETQALAERVAAHSDSIVLRSITWK